MTLVAATVLLAAQASTAAPSAPASGYVTTETGRLYYEVAGEGPNVVRAFADLETPTLDIEASILGAIVYDGGTERALPLAYVHPHGSWIDWIAG